ncbi:hypothetical protein ACHAWU_000222 [Discostella pseudostelligera]|uniref:Uncharacterized protein n=1 Tax=Discostella pseudostelligera TaxID=259834 RepID=A0ABD3MUL1_9STRA
MIPCELADQSMKSNTIMNDTIQKLCMTKSNARSRCWQIMRCMRHRFHTSRQHSHRSTTTTTTKTVSIVLNCLGSKHNRLHSRCTHFINGSADGRFR